MAETLTMLLAGGKGSRLHPLTIAEAKPAVPFGGIYRIIDFTLSNCVNSGMRKIFVLTQYRSHTLHRHLHYGWDFLSHYLDEFIEPIPPQQRRGENWYLGTADAIYQNMYLLDRYGKDDLLILSGDHIYKMDYDKMLAEHRDNNADLTISTIECPIEQASGFGVMVIDESNNVIGFEEKPENPTPMPGNSRMCLANMGVYVFKISVLKELLEADAKDDSSSHDFGKDIIPDMIKKMDVYAYNFRDKNKKVAKYWRDVGTIDSYFETNMDLISPDPQLNLYDPDWPIRTFQSQYPPPKFVFGDIRKGRVGIAIDSMVSQGCIVSGGRVQNCIISPGARINSYVDLTQSIVFHDADIGRHCKIRNTIIDKGVKIPPRTTVGYDLEEDKKRFTVTDSGIVVIPRTWNAE
ncbi:MAG: glucose-1-phosphate adenylyltransferase [Planctomycetota bacterium]|nr:glucose-1-phosphate adenylyltransferase [Planctomycetota bacterium]